MTTSVTDANFKIACGEVYDAIASESWASAHKWAAKAEALNAGLDLQLSDERASKARRETLRGLRDAIDAAEKAVSKYANTAGRFITTRVKF